jgi:hypothetical protein
LKVNASGDVTFGSGTLDYASESIASVARSFSSGSLFLSASGTIKMPTDSGNIDTFFGNAKVVEGNRILTTD